MDAMVKIVFLSNAQRETKSVPVPAKSAQSGRRRSDERNGG